MFNVKSLIIYLITGLLYDTHTNDDQKNITNFDTIRENVNDLRLSVARKVYISFLSIF